MTCKVHPDGAFLHIPKTGGTWVRAVLEKNNLCGIGIGVEHSSSHFEKWAFCVLREPLAWWLSLWRYRNDTGFTTLDGQHPLYPVVQLAEVDGVCFLERAVAEFPGFLGRMYADFIANADFALQTEQLAEHLQSMGSRVGWPILDLNVERLNVTPRRAIALTDSLSRKVREVEPDAMMLWQNASPDWTTFEI